MFLSAGGVITRSIAVYRTNFGSLMRYVGLMFALLAVSILILVIGVVAIVGGGASMAVGGGLQDMLGSISISVQIFLLVWFIAFIIVNAWFQVAFMRTVSRATLGQPKISVGQELKESRQFIGRILGVSILSFLITALPIIVSLTGWFTVSLMRAGGSFSSMKFLGIFFSLLGIYGIFHMIYFSVRFGFATTAAVIDNHTALDSFKKSTDLVKGRWWGILGRRLAAGIVLIFPYYILAMLSQIEGIIGVIFGLLTFVYYIFCLIPMILVPAFVIYHSAKESLHSSASKTV